MASSFPSLADLVTQMQDNVNAIHQRLSILSDTKDHDDEIERLENERLQRVEDFTLQQEKDAQELADKRKQVANAAAEKRRLQREQVALKRKQEEDELAAARKREEEELAARRKKEDDARQAKLDQEEAELRVIEQQEEDQWLALQAEEDEKRRVEAEELENGLHDEMDVKMTEKEEEMERRMAEGQRALRELDEKRKAINALIDAQINGTPITPSFRRGSKRYSTSPLAANVAAMLARGEPPSDNNHINEPVRADKPDPKDLPKRGSNEFARRNTIVEESETPRTIASENDTPQATTTGERFPSYKETQKRITAKSDSKTASPVEHVREIPREALSRDISPVFNDAPVTERIGAVSRAIEDPEDKRAREEMERINAEIMAEMKATEEAANPNTPELDQAIREADPEVGGHTARSLDSVYQLNQEETSVTPSLKQTRTEDPEDIRAREEMARINAEIMAEALAEEQATQQPANHPEPQLAQKKTVEDSEDVRAREEMTRLNAEIMAEALAAEGQERTRSALESAPALSTHYPVTSHEHLPTWADQADLAVVYGSHGMLKFREGGADMEVLNVPQESETRKAISDAQLPFYDVIQHQLLPTWADQADLEIVSGEHGTLVFRDGGADMFAVQIPQQAANVQKQETAFPAYDVPQHALLPTWADQAELSVVSGSHAVMVFREGGADLKVVEHPQPDEALKVDELAKYLRAYQVIQHRLLPTWVNQAKLSMVQGSHGVLAFGDDGADMAVVETPKSAKRASIFRMRERADTHRQSISRFNVIKHMHLPTCADQATLSVVRGSHGQISFRNGVADMIVVDAPECRKILPTRQQPQPRKYDVPQHEHLPTWANQANLSVVYGTHGQLAFRAGGADMTVIETVNKKELQIPHAIESKPVEYSFVQHQHLPTWADQASLAIVHGTHGQLSFRDGGADMAVIETQTIVNSQQVSRGMKDFKPTLHEITQHKRFPTWADQASLSTVYGAHGQLVFLDDGADMVVIAAPQLISNELQQMSIVVEETVTITYDIVQHSHLPTWADQKGLPVVEGAHGVLVFNKHGADMEVAPKAEAEELEIIAPRKIPAIVPEAMWFSKPRASSIHPQGPTRLGSVNTITSISEDDANPSTEAVEQSPRSVEVSSPATSEPKSENEMPGHMKQRFPFLAKRMAAKQAAENQLPPSAKETSPLTTDQSNSSVIEQTLVAKALPNGLGSATMNHGVEKRPSPPREASTDSLPSEVVEVAGVVYNLEHPALEELVHTHDHHPNPYWVDQSTLKLVKGSHGALRFTHDGAEMAIVASPRAPHPYWTADQSKLNVVKGSHGLLTFHKTGSYMVPFINRGRPIPVAMTSKKLPPTSRAYWEADQSKLEVLQGLNAVLIFQDDSQIASMGIRARKQSQASAKPQWVDQATLQVVRGAHATLIFGEEGAHMTIAQTKSVENANKSLQLSKNPYWVDQAKLEIVNGSHGVLVFHSSGADLKVLKSPVTIEKTPSRANRYWVDQSQLDILRGSHATLAFRDGGAAMNVLPVRNANQPSTKAIKSHAQSTDLYWVDQATLQQIRGSHAVLTFRNGGAEMNAVHVRPAQKPFDKVKSQFSNPYWVDQATLKQIRGSHAALVFQENSANMNVVHIPQPKEFTEASITSINQSTNPYWVDQATLEIIRGSHACLAFRSNGADMKAIQISDVQDSPRSMAGIGNKSSHRYWVDQSTLKVVNGTHAMLFFDESGSSLKPVRAVAMPERVSFRPSTTLANPPAYWVDQAKLDIVTGSHGTLSFSPKGASLIAYSLPLPESKPSRPSPYWADQATLDIVRGNHGILTFHESGASLVPHDEPIAYFDDHESSHASLHEDFEHIPRAVSIDEGARFPVDDFTDVSSQSSFVSYPDSQDEIAQLVARDTHYSSNYREHEYLSDVPELDSEIDDQFHESHDVPTSPGYDSEDWAPRSLDNATMPASKGSVNNHLVEQPDPHHDVRRDSEHALFEDTEDEQDLETSNQHNEPHTPEPVRSSVRLGAFASLANVVKDNVPLVSHMMGDDKGNYASLSQPETSSHREPSLHIRTNTAETLPSSETYGSHDAHSPITPTDSHASPVHESQVVEEPIIRSSWPESTVGHEIEYDSYEPREMKAQASPHPTQTEFDPFNPQIYASNLKSPTSIKSFHSSRADLNEGITQASPTHEDFQFDPRTQYKTPKIASAAAFKSRLPMLNTEQAQRSEFMSTPARSSTSSRPTSQEFHPSHDASPSRPMARKGTVSDRVNSINGGQASPSSNIFQKTRALFESASSPTAPPTTRPVSGIFHAARSKRSSLQLSEMAPEGELIVPRSLDSDPKPPSPGFRIPADEREDEFYKPVERHTNPFYNALSSVTNGLSSSMHNPANPPEKARLLGSGN